VYEPGPSREQPGERDDSDAGHDARVHPQAESAWLIAREAICAFHAAIV
jgi:hypothetical protein